MPNTPPAQQAVNDAVLAEARNKLDETASDLREIDGKIREKRGALQQVGGEVARQRAEDAGKTNIQVIVFTCRPDDYLVPTGTRRKPTLDDKQSLVRAVDLSRLSRGGAQSVRSSAAYKTPGSKPSLWSVLNRRNRGISVHFSPDSANRSTKSLNSARPVVSSYR